MLNKQTHIQDIENNSVITKEEREVEEGPNKDI